MNISENNTTLKIFQSHVTTSSEYQIYNTTATLECCLVLSLAVIANELYFNK